MIGLKKTTEAKIRAAKNYKERMFWEGRCRDCGIMLPKEEQANVRCRFHTRWNRIRMIAKRAFMKDFK